MFAHLISFLQNFFVPSLCISCKYFIDEEKPLCIECTKLLEPLVSYQLMLTPTRSFWVYCVGAYKAPLRPLINAKHYADVNAAKFLGQLICDYTPILELSFDYIVPVPLHWTRSIQRGYNQAEIMAHEISQSLGVPVLNSIKRTRQTNFQFLLPKRLRFDNVTGAFEIMPNLDCAQYKGKRFLIVDDLMTTGATVREVARTLNRSLQPSEIIAVVVSRVV